MGRVWADDRGMPSYQLLHQWHHDLDNFHAYASGLRKLTQYAANVEC